METIAEKAKTYEAGQTGNISELQSVSTKTPIVTKSYKEGTEDEFRLNIINVEGTDYRVPASVLANLKVLLEERPELETFKVRKDGTGMQTRYTVIPLK